MATNEDFDDLIVRIEAATETLEADVLTITTATGSIADAVEDAETAASNAAISAGDAADSANDAQLLVTALESAVIIEEAPEDGQQYAREDGAWVVVEAGGGDVESVNGQTGIVALDASDVGALPDTYVPAWGDVTGKPSFATVATTGVYADLTSKPTLGTVSPLAVVTGTGDTTGTSIPTVAWVNANTGSSGVTSITYTSIEGYSAINSLGEGQYAVTSSTSAAANTLPQRWNSTSDFAVTIKLIATGVYHLTAVSLENFFNVAIGTTYEKLVSASVDNPWVCTNFNRIPNQAATGAVDTSTYANTVTSLGLGHVTLGTNYVRQVDDSVLPNPANSAGVFLLEIRLLGTADYEFKATLIKSLTGYETKGIWVRTLTSSYDSGYIQI